MRFLIVLLALAATAAAAQRPADTTAFDEVAPVLIGGIEALQQGIAYPDLERRGGIQGRVIVLFTVQTDGVPADVFVARSVSPGLDMAAVAAVHAARFLPGTQDGVPVLVRQSLPVTFRIDGVPFPYVAQSGFDVNSRWDSAFAARADSGAVAGGSGRLRWTDLPLPYSRALVVVEDSVVTEIVWTMRASAEGDAAMVDASKDGPVPVRADGYLYAADLVAAGEAALLDRRVNSTSREIRFRRPQCAACTTPFPMLLGGVRGVVARAAPGLPQGLEAGHIEFAMDVDGEGRVFDVRVVSSTLGGRAGRAAEHALRDAFSEARFVVDPLRAGPAPQRVTVPVHIGGAD